MTKRVAAAKPIIIAKPQVLVVHEKHEDKYFYIQNVADLHAAALAIVDERLDAGFYELGPGPKALDYAHADLTAMPVSLREKAARALKDHERESVLYLDEVGDYAIIVKTVANKDGAVAWRILNNRKDYEYEGFNLNDFERSFDGNVTRTPVSR